MAGIDRRDYMFVGKGFSSAARTTRSGMRLEPYAVFNFDTLKAGDFDPTERARLFVRGGFTKLEGKFKASGLSSEGFRDTFEQGVKDMAAHDLISDVMNLGDDCILFSMNPGYFHHIKWPFSGLLVARFSSTENRAQQATRILENYARHRDADMVAHKPYPDA